MRKAIRFCSVIVFIVVMVSPGFSTRAAVPGDGMSGQQAHARRRAVRKRVQKGAARSTTHAATGRRTRSGESPAIVLDTYPSSDEFARRLVEHVINRAESLAAGGCSAARDTLEKLRDESSLEQIRRDLRSKGVYDWSSFKRLQTEVDSRIDSQVVSDLVEYACSHRPVTTGCPWPLNIVFRC
jgi:hypothetical protein